MCRNIRTLFNFDPPATPEEIKAAALQYVRKISGYNKPSQQNAEAFGAEVEAIEMISGELLGALVTGTAHRNREVEVQRAKKRNDLRFGRKTE